MKKPINWILIILSLVYLAALAWLLIKLPALPQGGVTEFFTQKVMNFFIGGFAVELIFLAIYLFFIEKNFAALISFSIGLFLGFIFYLDMLNYVGVLGSK